jgi:hypothetical protein
MMRTVGELTALLGVAGVASAAAVVLTGTMLVQTRRDRAAVRQAGIGNGRRAAADGEHRLAWIRLWQAVTVTVTTSALMWAGMSASSPTSRVDAVWTVVAASLTVLALSVCWASWHAHRIRRAILKLGLTVKGSDDG